MAGGWTIETEVLDPDEWDVAADYDADDVNAWSNPIPTGVTAKDTFLGVAEAPEDLRVAPENVDVAPEYLQFDADDWTIEAEPS